MEALYKREVVIIIYFSNIYWFSNSRSNKEKSKR